MEVSQNEAEPMAEDSQTVIATIFFEMQLLQVEAPQIQAEPLAKDR